MLSAIAYRPATGKDNEPLLRQVESGPAAKICSRDKQYCVQMIPTPGQPDESTLRVSAGGTILAEFKTFGYLLDVFSAPTQRMWRSTIDGQTLAIIYGSLYCEMVRQLKCQTISQTMPERKNRA